MQWSQVVWWKFSFWNGWDLETISSLVNLSIEEGRYTGTWCWSWTATGWSRTTASLSNCPSKNSSVRMACRGHAEAKTRAIKAFPIIFICCRFMFETRSCARSTYFEVWFNFSPIRMRRIGLCEASFPTDSRLMMWEQSQLLSIMKFPEAWTAREAARRRQFELRRLAVGFL